MSFTEPKIPESMGRCADLYHDVRELRLAMEKEVEPVKAFEAKIKQHIIDNLSKSEDTGASGLRYRAQITQKVKPSVADWPAFHSYVQSTGRFDLLQKRASDTAITAMWGEGEDVPGVERFNAIDVSITKI